MSRQHVVRQGEHLSSIAWRYGFVHEDAIWSHPQNAELRKKRASPHILAPGDTLFIPDRKAKTATVATGAEHRFILKRSKLELAVRLLDWQGAPMPGEPCLLIVDGVEEELTSDGDGVVRGALPRDAQSALLEFGEMRLALAIGNLDPLEVSSGLQARLNSLCYWAGVPGDGDEQQLRFAIEFFQHDRGLEPDGEITPALVDALKEAFGC